MLCGKIAAGKSTLARQLAAHPAHLLISEDRWTATLFPGQLTSIEDYRTYSARLRAAMGPHVAEVLRQGLSVALDFPANTPAQRAWMRGIITQSGAEHRLHLLDVPDDICKRRLAERNASGTHAYTVDDATFDVFTRAFIPPAPEEGFTIIRYPHPSG